MRKLKLLSSLLIAVGAVVCFGGCTYAHNQAWESLSDEEKAQVIAEFEKEEGEIRADMTDDEFEAMIQDFILKMAKKGFTL